MTTETGSYSSGHVHSYIGDPPRPSDDGWTYYQCSSCPYRWRTKTISEPVSSESVDEEGK